MKPQPFVPKSYMPKSPWVLPTQQALDRPKTEIESLIGPAVNNAIGLSRFLYEEAGRQWRTGK
jgi:hypothetical protein